MAQIMAAKQLVHRAPVATAASRPWTSQVHAVCAPNVARGSTFGAQTPSVRRLSVVAAAGVTTLRSCMKPDSGADHDHGTAPAVVTRPQRNLLLHHSMPYYGACSVTVNTRGVSAASAARAPALYRSRGMSTSSSAGGNGNGTPSRGVGAEVDSEPITDMELQQGT